MKNKTLKYSLVILFLITSLSSFSTNDDKNKFQKNSFKNNNKNNTPTVTNNNAKRGPGNPISGNLLLLVAGNVAFWGYKIGKNTKKQK